MGYTPDFTSRAKLLFDRLQDRVNDPVAQRRLVLIVVCIALLLDNMLYMVIVPIIPNFLRAMHEPVPNTEPESATTTTTTTAIVMTSWTGNMSLWGKGWYNATYRWSTPKPTKVPPPPVSYGNEGGAIGVLFASKAIIQLCVNPFTGTLIDRIGYDIPMMIGLGIMFLSTSVFAFGKSYAVLFIARSMQGLGSAFADTSGLAMIADRFTEEAERTKALGIALAFISFGCLFAPPFGGILYQFAGKTVPFLILASICLIDGVLLLTVMKPVRLSRSMFFANTERPKGTPIYRLLIDPYIAVCAGALAMSNVSLAFLEPTISLWMKDRMDADEWEIGFVWLPAFIPHIAGVYITVKLARNYPQYQWLMAAIGLAIEGIFCFFIPFAKAFFVVIFPIMGICFGIALVDTALLPMLGYLVDVRYVSVYGSVYAIADISYSLAYAFGPVVAGSVVHAIGFLWLNVLIFLSNVGYAPVMMMLRKVYKYSRFEDEEDVLVHDTGSFGHPDYKTYVQNGGISGKPHPIDSKGDDFANHLKIANQQPLYSGEIDCYPPTNDMDYGYESREPPSFYQR
ncbi:putative vesicular acetylcholine transporter-B [Babylonia areolata]|uniref:putative vesicular acetylcholine transporter-B n=1 Tax=Babylonia areolata TaxID=304850 RepID=UPI003FD63B9B